MASNEKKRGSFMGHPLLDQEHAHELHLASALNEFQGGIPRADAEKRALEDYRHEHHARAAAHHFGGVKAAHAVGDTEAAQKHHALYSLHVKALGEDPMGPVPEVVRKFHSGAGQDSKQKRVYNFRGHDADEFLVKPISKSETALSPAELLLKAGAALSATIKMELCDYLIGLEKGDVVDIRSGQTIAPPQRMPESWAPQAATCDNENCAGGNSRYAAEAAPGYSLCPGCIDTLRRAHGQPAYDPQEHAKQGFATPQDMHRARIGGLFNPELGGAKPRSPLTLVKKSEDPVKLAAQRLGKTLEVLALAKNVLAELQKK
jgi:hypothetical protein